MTCVRCSGQVFWGNIQSNPDIKCQIFPTIQLGSIIIYNRVSCFKNISVDFLRYLGNSFVRARTADYIVTDSFCTKKSVRNPHFKVKHPISFSIAVDTVVNDEH